MWNQFLAEFELTSPVKLDVEERMLTFLENVASIVEHNSNPAKTFTRGINRFSAMTQSEFADYYNFEDNQVSAEQNCSATRSSPLTA